MNLSFYIARRYLLSKKSHNAINWISGISVVGVAVATMALVVTLSVFNGFHDMVKSFYTTLDPELKIVPKTGKTVASDDPLLMKVGKIDGVEEVSECLEDQALLVYGDNQKVVSVKGVDEKFQQLTRVDSILYGDGEFKLWEDELDMEAAERGEMAYKKQPCVIPGIGVAEELGLSAMFQNPLMVYAPQREGQFDIANPTEGFNEEQLYSSGVVFCVKQAKYDKNYVIVPLDFARRLFDQQGMLSSLNIKVKDEAGIASVERRIKAVVGEKYDVLTQEEQQEDVFKIMKVEKLIAYIFLTFILLVACFNIIGSLSMLIIDKKDDVATLRSLGADNKLISRIFLFEGRLISTIGAVIGIIIGLVLCWIQQTYGIIALGGSSGNFVVDSYPVSVHATDIVIIFVTVLVVGYLSVWYPVRFLSKRLVG